MFRGVGGIFEDSQVAYFFNDTATTEIYTLSLHDALPIWPRVRAPGALRRGAPRRELPGDPRGARPRDECPGEFSGNGAAKGGPGPGALLHQHSPLLHRRRRLEDQQSGGPERALRPRGGTDAGPAGDRNARGRAEPEEGERMRRAALRRGPVTAIAPRRPRSGEKPRARVRCPPGTESA